MRGIVSFPKWPSADVVIDGLSEHHQYEKGFIEKLKGAIADWQIAQSPLAILDLLGPQNGLPLAPVGTNHCTRSPNPQRNCGIVQLNCTMIV
jgi:hypothetical protein